MAEMLVQSHAVQDQVPVVELLPALPPHWPAGRVRGLRARGGVTVADLRWADGRVQTATLVAEAPTTVTVRWTGADGLAQSDQVSLTAGPSVTVVGP